MNDCKVAISKLLEASLEHLKSNRHFEAEKCIRQILALDNKCGQAWHQLARIAEHFGNLDQALHLNHNAFLLELNNSEYIAYQGRIFLMAQKIDAAIEWLKKSIEINPEYLDAHYYLAIAYQFIKDHEKAIIALQAVVKINENHAAANQMLAQLLIENNQWENGVDFYKKNINPELLGLVFESSLVGVKAWAMSRRLEVMEFGDKEEIVVSQPKSFGQYFQTEVGTVYGNKLYAAELENVSAIAKGETLLTDDQLSLNDAAVDYQYGSLVDLRFSEYIKYRNNEKLLIDLSGYQKINCQQGVYLGGRSSLVYGHWFAEHLPKLEILQSLAKYRDWPIYVESGMPESHYESLRLLLDNDQKLIQIPEKTCIQFDKLIAISAPTFFPFVCRPGTRPNINIAPTSIAACKYIRNKIWGKQNMTSDLNCDDKIYLGRRSGLRSLKNSREIEDFFINIGFRVIYPEDYSFAEQVAIFYKSNFVVGPNGSAFVNIIFCRPGTRVISFAQPYAANFPAWAAAVESMGIDHIYVIGRALTGTSSHEHHENYEIDLNDVKNAVMS